MVRRDELIGRHTELAELQAMLGATRVLTITGVGGCGKTRLALELAHRVNSSEDGPECVIAPLSSVAGEGQLLDTLLGALGARERFGSRPIQILRERVAGRRLLLVIDNCEHLMPSVRGLVGELLDAAPELSVLATSREPLARDGEHVLQLGPLSLPDADGGVGAVVRSDAGRLFVDRAASVDPEFALTPQVASAVTRICRELDGLPLALVLAAARLDTLSVEDIAQGLSQRGRLAAAVGEDELSKHRSMRASLDWSYLLLDEQQRVLLRRLSVFSGGFTAAAAHTVAAPEISETRVRDLLGSLEAKGLIVAVPSHGQARWTFLQTVGEYTAERLAAENEHEQIADRHLAWFRSYATSANTLLERPDGHELIDSERANLSLALDRARQHDPPCALQIAASLMRHWILAEHLQEARSVCAAVLAAVSCESDAVAGAVVHCGAGLVGMLSEDYTAAIEHTRTGLELLDIVEDPSMQATCLQLSSMVLIQTGLDLDEGLHNAERAVELQRSIEDPLGLAFALVNLAVAAMLCERFDQVGDAYSEFLAVPARDHARLRTWAEQTAAWAQVTTGSPERALEHANLGIALEGDWPSMTHFQVLGFRIHALSRLGRTEQALQEGADAMLRAQESGALQAIPAIELALMVAELMHGDPDAAEIRARRLLEMPHLHTLALAREILARIALMRADACEAETHARELQAIAGRSGNPRHRALADYIRGCSAVRITDETDGGRICCTRPWRHVPSSAWSVKRRTYSTSSRWRPRKQAIQSAPPGSPPPRLQSAHDSAVRPGRGPSTGFTPPVRSCPSAMRTTAGRRPGSRARRSRSPTRSATRGVAVAPATVHSQAGQASPRSSSRSRNWPPAASRTPKSPRDCSSREAQ